MSGRVPAGVTLTGPSTVLRPTPLTAAQRYAICTEDQRWHLDVQQCHLCLAGRHCRIGRRIHQSVDAASLSYDLAEAEASIERTREAIPW